jgi:1-deoxy-D-xylulose-5-phosphate synthase
VILNDNEMSIAPPVGAMSKYLSGLYANGPLGAAASDGRGVREGAARPAARPRAARAAAGDRGCRAAGTLFEELGFTYIGPIDGHDMTQLLPVLRAARARATGPVLIHVCTVKGKGYAPAESSGRQVSRRGEVRRGDRRAGEVGKSNAPSYTKVFGDALTNEAARDPRIVAVTAAMPSGTGLDIMPSGSRAGCSTSASPNSMA